MSTPLYDMDTSIIEQHVAEIVKRQVQHRISTVDLHLRQDAIMQVCLDVSHQLLAMKDADEALPAAPWSVTEDGPVWEPPATWWDHLKAVLTCRFPRLRLKVVRDRVATHITYTAYSAVVTRQTRYCPHAMIDRQQHHLTWLSQKQEIEPGEHDTTELANYLRCLPPHSFWESPDLRDLYITMADCILRSPTGEAVAEQVAKAAQH